MLLTEREEGESPQQHSRGGREGGKREPTAPNRKEGGAEEEAEKKGKE